MEQQDLSGSREHQDLQVNLDPKERKVHGEQREDKVSLIIQTEKNKSIYLRVGH